MLAQDTVEHTLIMEAKTLTDDGDKESYLPLVVQSIN